MAEEPTDQPNTSPPSTTAVSSTESDEKTAPHRRRGRRSKYATKDLTKGSIPKNLWFLAWPQITESFLSVVDQLADLVWAGRIGFHAIAGTTPTITAQSI